MASAKEMATVPEMATDIRELAHVTEQALDPALPAETATAQVRKAEVVEESKCIGLESATNADSNRYYNSEGDKTMKLGSIMKVAALMMVSALSVLAQAGRSNGRSERFDTDDVKTVEGMITKVDHPYATLKAEDGNEYKIHLGPFWFWEHRDYSLKINANAKLKGEVENVKGAMHFYPWEIVQDGRIFTLAGDDGVPSWAGKRSSRGQGKGAGYGGGRGRDGRGRGFGTCCW
jgi:hypothetical protein